jgi:hypothetical protein
MNTLWKNLTASSLVAGGMLLVGCSDTVGPREQSLDNTLLSATSVVTQDLGQLSAAGVTSEVSRGVFSIGWKKFVGPNITDAGTVGEAFAVVHPDTDTTMIRPGGIDLGTVTLTYSGGATELTKRVTPDGRVMYATFGREMRLTETPPVNIPFVANGLYTFDVTGSSAFSAGTFQITAPPSLLTLTGHASGDTVSSTSDLSFQWTGGSASDSVLIRIVPHLRPEQLTARERQVGPGGCEAHGGNGGPRGHRHGRFIDGGPLEQMGPEFARGIFVTIPNAGTYTVSAADLQSLIGGTEAAELMIGVTQVVKQDVLHDGSSLTLLLRNGDRIVLHVK